MSYQTPLATKTDSEILAMPTTDIQTQLTTAQRIDAYFTAAVKTTANGEFDIDEVGKVSAKNVDGISPEESILPDGAAVESVFHDRSATEKIEIRRKAAKAIHAGVLGLSNKDEIKQAKAAEQIRHRGLEEKFVHMQKLQEMGAHTFLTNIDGYKTEKRSKNLYDFVRENPKFKAMIETGEWAGADTGKNVDIRFDDADPSAALLRSDPNYMIHDRDAWNPEVTRTGEVIMDPVRGIQVTHLFQQIPTMQEAIRFEQETIVTDNVKGFDQTQALQESQLSVADKTVAIVNFGHYMSLHEIAVQDEPRIQWLLNYRLPEMVRRALDGALIEGTGLNGTITGLASTTGIQSRAKPNGSDETIIDALLKGKTRARVMNKKDIGMPNAYILHTEDKERICLTKTTEGMYIYGNPVGGQPMTVWGLPVVEYNGGDVGTAWCGDFMMYAALYMRKGLTVNFGMINDDFIKLRQAIRAYMRCQLVVTRPSAFMKMTNLDG